MTTWFTSDHHFGHDAIRGYTNRPFDTVEEMDAELIRRWNSRVQPDDIVYHLGDFTLGGLNDACEYFEQLNGHIHVLGNWWHHDRRWLEAWRESNVDLRSAQGKFVHVLAPMIVLELPQYGGGEYPKPLVLCHYPLAVWDRKHYGSWHLFGHSHGQHNNGGLSFDVGVDANNYRPVSLEGVARQMKVYAAGAV